MDERIQKRLSDMPEIHRNNYRKAMKTPLRAVLQKRLGPMPVGNWENLKN